MTTPADASTTASSNVKLIGLGIVFDAQRRRVLISRRRDDAVLGGLWEFPGGKVEGGETLEACVRRELLEEVGVEVEVERVLDAVEHRYAHATVRLVPAVCRHVGGEARPLEVAACAWVSGDELRRYEFPPANASILAQVVQLIADAQRAT